MLKFQYSSLPEENLIHFLGMKMNFLRIKMKIQIESRRMRRDMLRRKALLLCYEDEHQRRNKKMIFINISFVFISK
jgi:hypothetical protein